MENEVIQIEMTIKPRDEFDFRRDFYSVWLTHTDDKIKAYYIAARKQNCTGENPSMFPDVQLNYTDRKAIIYLVPKEGKTITNDKGFL